MTRLLPRDQWFALRRLYIAGRRGVEYERTGYHQAGSWAALRQLRDHDPVLAREVTRTGADRQMRYYVVITAAGIRFYEAHERLHDMFYPPAD